MSLHALERFHSKLHQKVLSLIAQQELPSWSETLIKAFIDRFAPSEEAIWLLLRLIRAVNRDESALLFSQFGLESAGAKWLEIAEALKIDASFEWNASWALAQSFCSNQLNSSALFFFTEERIGFLGVAQLEQESLEALFAWPSNEKFVSQSERSDFAYDASALMDQLCAQRKLFLFGGPGSGKSTLIAKLVETYLSRFPNAAAGIRLVAPTARAAQRLEELTQRVRDCSNSALASASTVHQLLKLRGNEAFSWPRFEVYPSLPVTLLIVDEASMLSNALLYALMKRLPERAHLLLVGDGEQLPSVELGGIFQAVNEHLNRQKRAKVSSSSSLSTQVWELNQTHRFAAESALGLLTHALRVKNFHHARIALQHSDDSFLWIEAPTLEVVASLGLQGYQPYFKTLLSQPFDPHRAWSAFSNFRLLVPLHEGPFGTKAVNRLFIQALKRLFSGKDSNATAIRGTPYMVLKNMNKVGLSNGQIGLANLFAASDAGDEESTDSIWFAQEGINESRSFALSLFLEEDLMPAFVMSGHKAQGSEFDCVLILIAESAPMPSLQWLYTALTRAKKRAILMATSTTLEKIFSHPSQKNSFTEEFLSRKFPIVG